MPQSDEFYRIKRLPPYVFAEVNRLKATYRAEGRDIIDFGMGNPDQDTPAHIVEKLVAKSAAVDGVAGLNQAIGEGRLTVVDVRDDRKVSNALLGNAHRGCEPPVPRESWG